MILCSCNVLTSARIREAAVTLALADPGRPVTPGRIFRLLGARPRCGTCFELVHRMLRELGLPMTCPEPLASEADAAVDGVAVEVEVREVVFAVLK